MQIIWRYLLGQYCRVFALCLVGFVAFLLVMRFKESAEFAALGAPFHQLLLYILYQIPFILPIAIPISCLIASILLLQNLSQSKELTALRAAGFSLRQLLAPLLVIGTCLSLVNFLCISEVSTRALLSSKEMIQNLTGYNPLLLLKNGQFLKFKDIHIESQSTNDTEQLQDLMLFFKDKKNQRIALFYAQTMQVNGDRIEGINSTLITHAKQEGFDHLIIDNQGKISTPVSEFVAFLKDTRFRVPYDHLHMPLLLLQKEKIRSQMLEGNSNGTLKQQDNRCTYEIMRRFSLGFAPLTFSLLGAAFGISLGREQTKKNLLIVIVLAAISCAAFFLAKSSSEGLTAPALMFFLPQLIMVAASIWKLDRDSKGIE